MKIALIGRYGEGEIVAGPERVARELFRELKNQNHQVVFIEYFFSGYKNSSVYKKLFGKEFLIDNSIIRLGIFPLILFLIKNKFEVIHIINLQRFTLFLFLIRPFIKTKFIATLHGLLQYEISRKYYWTKRYFFDSWVERLIIKKCGLIIFPSKLLFEIFNEHYKIVYKKYCIIPNGVSEIFNGQRIYFPPIENSIKLVFYIGLSESTNNGLGELVALLKDVKYKIELYVIGKKAEMISSNHIEIIYMGLKSHGEMIYFLSDKHFVIKSFIFDTFSIFVAECMCLGLIPIINENIGIKDYIKNNVNGFIYDSSYTNDLSKYLDEIYKSNYDLNLISTNAKGIYEVLNWGRVTKQYIKAYEGLLY